VWIYRRHFDHPADAAGRGGQRVFADFEGVMVSAVAVLNGWTVGSHQGGCLPWSVELTRYLVPGLNVLAVIVDARCRPVPPIALGQGPESIDFLQPGGIYREAALRVVPPAHLADVFAAHGRAHRGARGGCAVHRGRHGTSRREDRDGDGRTARWGAPAGPGDAAGPAGGGTHLKTPGVLDTFRVAKPGAAI
jgi:hypothetical protein